jgi:hypothetical protein
MFVFEIFEILEKKAIVGQFWDEITQERSVVALLSL